MTVVFSKWSLTDYDEWKRAFDANETVRNQAGIELVGIFRNVGQEEDVLLAVDVPDSEAFGKMLTSPELMRTIRESGISTDVEYWTGVHLATVPLSG